MHPSPVSDLPAEANTSGENTAENPSYLHYGQWLRNHHGGHRVFKIIVDAGFSCPNRDGSKAYGGCSYCNVDAFTPTLPRSLIDIREQVSQGITRARNHYRAEKFILYFQPNSNTHAPISRLREVYDEALSVCPEDVVGLSVGTRPDCLDPEKIALLESYSKHLTVDLELGMESIHDDTLRRINRGCLHGELVGLLESLSRSPLHICVHTILGFPWESTEMILAQAEEINRFPQIRFLKLHHLHIVHGSAMAAHYRKSPFELLSLEQYTALLCEFLPRLRADIVIQRLFGICPPDLLIAPQWNLPKSAVQCHIERALKQHGIQQGSRVLNIHP